MTPSRLPFLALLLASSLAPVHSEEPGGAWRALQGLVGEWEGTVSGQPARVSYRSISNGTALLETLDSPDSGQMVTVYHPDGARLLMTHYCSAGNQSRMRAAELRGHRLVFEYLDASNLKSPDEPRMTRLEMSFPGPDRLVHEWTSTGGGQDHVGRLEFRRKK
jgi:hypothetical protein